MTLKETVQSKFVEALKSKNEIAKSALSGLKAKITEAEKKNSNKELTDPEVLKVIDNSIKQRIDSRTAYLNGNRLDLAEKENLEIGVLDELLPTPLTLDEAELEIRGIISTFKPEFLQNKKAAIGKTTGEMNKKFPGRCPSGMIELITNIIE